MRRILFVLAAAIGLANFAMANPLCVSGQTVAYYEANYTTLTNACQVGDKLFYGFNYTSIGQNGAATVPNSAVTVIADPSNPNEPGLIFQGSWSVSATSPAAAQILQDSNLQFSVSVIGGLALIQDASLNFAGTASSLGGAIAQIAETVILNGGTTSATLKVDTLNGPFRQTVGFAPQSTVRVTKDMFLAIPAGQTGSAQVTQFREGFSEIPEPLTTVLLGSGLVGLGFLRRRR
jgi:hypothetical protein